MTQVIRPDCLEKLRKEGIPGQQQHSILNCCGHCNRRHWMGLEYLPDSNNISTPEMPVSIKHLQNTA